ncbi:MAG TPA: dicarboxylate/amino acid:cation symporter [Vicinamibacterales bacterium]|nr:dicarboxylate/amino acid:cation symporter [Vicinamibacterales bacterium]
MALHNRILIGLLAGAIAGIVTNVTLGLTPGVEWAIRNVIEPLGRIWLNALIMVVIPLIVSTLALGVAGLGSISKLGRIGLLTLMSFLALTTMAVILGLFAVNTVRPGEGLDLEVRNRLMAAYSGQSEGAMGLAKGALGINTFVNIVPRNPVQAAANGEMLAVIFFALMIGIALTTLRPDKAEPMLRFLDSLAHVTIAIIEMVMKFAPYAVFALIFSVTARFGFDLLLSLLLYVLTVVGSLVVFYVVGYSLVLKFVAGRSPMEFFRKTRIVTLTAFSTSSSNATLPTTLRVTEEELRVPPQIAGFVIPLGATMNMNGTALFEGITVLFIAQVFGVTLSLGQQLIVVLMSVVTAIGVAGIPGGSIPLLMMVLAMVGLPAEGIAIVLGVDRILDMCRTTVNVAGDMVTATIVDRFEGRAAGAVPLVEAAGPRA